MFDRAPMGPMEFAALLAVVAVTLGVFFAAGAPLLAYLIPLGVSIYAITARISATKKEE